MPELPEVETVRKSLEDTIINKKIVQVEVFYPKVFKMEKKSYRKSPFLKY